MSAHGGLGGVVRRSRRIIEEFARLQIQEDLPGRSEEPAQLGGRGSALQGAIRGLAYHPTSTFLAAASRDGTVRLWDTDAGQAIGEPLRLDPAATALAFSPNG